MLVGRDAELAVLDALITQARAGAGGVVLLTGEPGVGKTRLARAGTERAAGATVSWGACRESEGAPPLWPDGLDTDLEMRLGRSLLLAGQVDHARDCFETRHRGHRPYSDLLSTD